MPGPIAVPIILGAAALAGSAINAWTTWQGIKKGEKATEAANRANIELFGRQLKTEAAESAKDRRFKREEQRREFGQRNYETFLDRITTMFNSKPKVADRLVMLQKSRGR